MQAQVHKSVMVWFHWMPGRSLSRRETIAADFDNSEPAVVDEWDMEELNGDSVWWKSRSSAASFLPSIYMQYTYLSRTPGTCRFTGTGAPADSRVCRQYGTRLAARAVHVLEPSPFDASAQRAE